MTSSPETTVEMPGLAGGHPEGATGSRAARIAGRSVVWAWCISAVYHGVLFVVMALLPWLSGLANDLTQVATPTTDLLQPVDRPTVSLAPSPHVEPATTARRPNPLEIAPQKFESVEAVASPRQKSMDILGIGASASDGLEDGFSVPFGGPGPEFFGLGGQARGARRIVYVVDRSGSMMTTFSGVVKELRESIGGLRRTQKFHVVFFNAGAPLENPPRRLVSAIQDHKRRAFEFFETITPGGSTDPRLAMRRAFEVEPDLVYFLTDGEFSSSLLEVLERLNRGREVRIFTIAYVNQQGAELLERIAREHNGEYRYVTEDEIFND